MVVSQTVRNGGALDGPPVLGVDAKIGIEVRELQKRCGVHRDQVRHAVVEAHQYGASKFITMFCLRPMLLEMPNL